VKVPQGKTVPIGEEKYFELVPVERTRVVQVCVPELIQKPVEVTVFGRTRSMSVHPPRQMRDEHVRGLLLGDDAEPAEDEGPSENEGAWGNEESSEERNLYAPGERPFTAFLQSLRPARRPGLHYLHTLVPHVPWRTFPSGQIYQALNWRNDLPLVTGEPTRHWIDEEWPLQLARQRHLLQVQYVDRLLGRMMERLRKVGMFDDTLLIVTSDHGLGLHAGRQRKVPTFENIHEVYWVPLFIKKPHQKQEAVDDRNVMAMDLLPTIADALDAEVPWRMEGRSLLDPNTARGPVKRIVRRWDPAISWPQETLTISLETAQKRMRREAFVPAEECRGVRCNYLVGPGASLVGRSLETFTIGAPSDLSASLTLPRTLRADRRGALPAFILGNLLEVEEGHEGRIAVAMNGRLAGASETWTQDGVPGWFGVLAPEHLVGPESNDLRLFEMDGSDLRPIAIVP
jgi:hypothetical protein